MTSWWIEAQRDRETFRAAVQAQMPRWQANEGEINKQMARIYTAHMVLGQAAPKAGFSSGLPQVRG
jgi:hypothetical protein